MAKEQMTPMMTQYLKTKEEYEDCILFYRLGDFYEMFFDDAIKASKELEITLTGKDCGLSERAPMCGVPFHSASVYIAKLIEKGYKVAICEQVEDPKTAKGIVKREVIRVVTPGTVVDEELLDEKNNNYLAVIYSQSDKYGFAVSDISTGEIYTTEISGADEALNEIARYEPKEILLNSDAAEKLSAQVELRFHITPDECTDDFFENSEFEKNILQQFEAILLKHQIFFPGVLLIITIDNCGKSIHICFRELWGNHLRNFLRRMVLHIIHSLLKGIGETLDYLWIFIQETGFGAVRGIRDIAGIHAQRSHYIAFSFFFKGSCRRLKFNSKICRHVTGKCSCSGTKINTLVDFQIRRRINIMIL